MMRIARSASSPEMGFLGFQFDVGRRATARGTVRLPCKFPTRICVQPACVYSTHLENPLERKCPQRRERPENANDTPALASQLGAVVDEPSWVQIRADGFVR